MSELKEQKTFFKGLFKEKDLSIALMFLIFAMSSALLEAQLKSHWKIREKINTLLEGKKDETL